MARPSKRTQSVRQMIHERERQRKVRKIEESSDEEEDVTAIGLIQGNANSEFDESDDDEVIVSEGEELEQVNESAFK